MFRVLSLAVGLLFAASAARAADDLQYGPPPAWVIPTAIPKIASPPEGAVQLLLEDVQSRYTAEADTHYSESAVRILSAQALAAAGNVSVVWPPDTEKITIHYLHIIRDGRVIDALAGGRKFTVIRREANLELATLDGALTATIQPEDLRVGDILGLAFTRERHDPIFQGRSEGAAALARPGVVGRVTIRELWPNYKAMRWQASDDLGKGVLVRKGDETQLTFDLSNVEAPKPPKDAPVRFSRLGILEMSQFSDWAEVSSLMDPLYRKASTLEAGSPLKAEIARIKSTSPDPRVRAEVALRLVEDQVRYVALLMNLGGYTPAAADLTWSRRFGDCKAKTALLLALLDGLGIEAQPALVNTTAGDALNDILPTVGAFDHVMVRARIGGLVYWLDGTRLGDRHLEDLAIPNFHWALPVQASGAKLEKLLPPPLIQPNIETHVDLDASGGLDLPAPAHLELVYRGDFGVSMHLGLAALNKADAERALREIWSNDYPWITASAVSSSYDDDKRVLRLVMDGAAKMDWTRSSGWRQFQISESNLGYTPKFSREPGPHPDAPYSLNYPTYGYWKVSVKLPSHGAGFTIGNAPDVDKTIAGVTYHRVSTLHDGVATMEASEKSLEPEFPASEAAVAEPALRELTSYDVAISTRAATTDVISADDSLNYGQQGIQALLKEDYGAAITDLTQAIKSDPQNSSNYYNRGLAYLETHRESLAVADFDATLKLRPSDSLALIGRGQARLVDDEDRLAEEDFGAAMKLAPGDYQIEFRRADAYRKAGRFEKAIGAFTLLIAKYPDAQHRSSLTGRCRARVGLGKELDLAVADCDAALRMKPDDHNAIAARGQAQFKLGRLDQAMADFKALLDVSPDDKDALCGRALIRQARGLRTEAAVDLARAGASCKATA